jgi:hypothetical protein
LNANPTSPPSLPLPQPPPPRALTGFLYSGGAPYKVDAAFIWSVGTWDVAAIHPISTSEEGTYADWEIVKWLRWLSSKAPF